MVRSPLKKESFGYPREICVLFLIPCPVRKSSFFPASIFYSPFLLPVRVNTLIARVYGISVSFPGPSRGFRKLLTAHRGPSVAIRNLPPGKIPSGKAPPGKIPLGKAPLGKTSPPVSGRYQNLKPPMNTDHSDIFSFTSF